MSNFNLIAKKWWFFALSLLMIVPGVISLALYGLNLGIDFSGGTQIEYDFGRQVDKQQLQQTVGKNGVEVSNIVVSGTTYIVRLKPLDPLKIPALRKSVEQEFGLVKEVEVDTVGPVIGAEITRNAFLAIILASVMIVIYIALAFRKVPRPASSWRFGIAAIAALLHDVLIVLGSFSLLGHFLGVEIDVMFVTAILTIIGFSVHDTIVVFDRIRENLPKHLSKSFSEVANISVLQTLGRSLSTSLTVVLALLALLLFGGSAIQWFVVALLIGIISGTYSSIFNATAILALWEEKLGH